MMNIWNPIYTNWVGTWNDYALPAFSYYDWISYSSYTPGAGDYGTGNNFTMQWKDELEFWDQDRWDLATHTFGGNLCDFEPSNIVFKDGSMILCLTDAIDTGFVDVKKPEVKWAREYFDNSIVVMFSEEVEKTVAETEENYLIANVEITEAIQSSDRMSVRLVTKDYNRENNYILIVLGIQDDAQAPNIIDLRGTAINKINELEFPIIINVGGGEITEYLGDQEWSEKVEYGYWGGDVRYWSQVDDILNTEDDEIYKSERVGLTTYKIRVPNGSYKVSLLFAKNENAENGDRVFDIVAENQIVQNNVDIFTLAGKNTAHIIETDLMVSDEIIDLYFPELIDSAFVNGIIVNKITTDVNERKSENLINKFRLYQNHPNPFNPTTQISFNIPEVSDISLEIYDVVGNKVKTLAKGKYTPGDYKIKFDASLLSSGIYFYQLISNGNNIATKKMLFLK